MPPEILIKQKKHPNGCFFILKYSRAKNVNRKPLPTPSGDGRDLKSQFSGGAFCPLEGTAFAGANCRGGGVSLAALPPFLCAIKEMGVNITITSVTKEAGRNF